MDAGTSSSSATPNGPAASAPPAAAAAATTACCLVCLEPAPAAGPGALACADGHRVCTRNGCLDRLAQLQLSDPTRLRTAAAAGRHIPCPSAGCPRGWDYAEVYPLLSPGAQLGAVEGLLAFVVRATTSSQQPAQASSEHEAEGSEAALAQRVREEVLNLRCPGCRAVFLDFDACCAVTCGACGLGFCGLCLVPAVAAAAAAGAMPVAAAQQNEAAHAHAVGVHGALFFSEERVYHLQNRFRTQRLVDFLLPSSSEEGLARALRVLAAVAPDCAALGLDVSRVEAALHRRARGLPAAAEDYHDEDAPMLMTAAAAAAGAPHTSTYHRHPSGRDLPGEPHPLVIAPGAAPPRRGPRVFFASPSSTVPTPATTIDDNDGATALLRRRRPGRLELDHLRGEEGRLRAAARFRKLPREASPVARLAPLPALGGRGGDEDTEEEDEEEEGTDGEEGVDGDRRRWKRRCAARPRSFSFSSHGVVEREESDWSVTSSVCGGIPLAGLGIRARAGSSGSDGDGTVLHTGRSGSLPPLSGGSQWAEGSGVTWEGGESTPSFFSSDEEGCYGWGSKAGRAAEEDEKEGVELAMDVGDGEAGGVVGQPPQVQEKEGGAAVASTNAANAGKRVLRFSF